MAMFAQMYAIDKQYPIIRRGDFTSFRFKTTDENGSDVSASKQKPLSEVFDTFFYTGGQAVSFDDVHKIARVRISLFMQLCVQAAQSTGLQKSVFQELLEKLQKKDYIKLNIGQMQAYDLTTKDEDDTDRLHTNVSVCEE